MNALALSPKYKFGQVTLASKKVNSGSCQAAYLHGVGSIFDVVKSVFPNK